jgi:hypothetical protein
MAEDSGTSPDTGSGPEDQGTTDGKAIKKTFEEIREEARREILSSADRDKYERLEPNEMDFVNKVCLYEEKSQKVARQHHKIKLREIMLCLDVAQAYCPSKDAVGQYSEAKRIMKNSETGGDSVKFVLGRKVCSMLDKICSIYQSNPPSYVRGDLHKAETDLLNYINRLGRMIREPLNEAKRIYNKLKERAGWDLPTVAFGMAEDCDVPQLFFNRYSSPAQLLLKDPDKPFRSDTLNPPLKLDFRIKNAVLIVAGENKFHLDKGRFDKVRETATAKFISAKSLQEGKDKIAKAYKRDNYELAEGLSLKDDLSVEAIKEDAFRMFYNYTLTSLPSTASRGDVAELFIFQLMKEENDIECKGFCRYLYPPEAVEDPSEPAAWTKKGTEAYKLRKVFQKVANGKIRLSMFPTQMNNLMSEYLENQLNKLKEQVADKFKTKIRKAETDLKRFIEANGSPLEQEQKNLETIEKLEAERGESIDKAFSLITTALHKNLKADTIEKKKELLGLIKPKLVEQLDNKTQNMESLKKKYQALSLRIKNLDAGSAEAAELNKKLKENMETIKKHFDHSVAQKNSLKKMISMIENADSQAEEISLLRNKKDENPQLCQEEKNLQEALKQATLEYEEAVAGIEEAIEVNREI